MPTPSSILSSYDEWKHEGRRFVLNERLTERLIQKKEDFVTKTFLKKLKVELEEHMGRDLVGKEMFDYSGLEVYSIRVGEIIDKSIDEIFEEKYNEKNK